MPDDNRTDVRTLQHRGWEVVQLHSRQAVVEVVPGKGGDILGYRWRNHDVDGGGDRRDDDNSDDNGDADGDVEVLWRSPWGLRPRGSAPTAGDSAANLIEWYPGGWQVMLPNGGDEVTAYGTTWGMHGEAWLAPFTATPLDGGIALHTRLVRSPLEITRHVTLDGPVLTVTETVTNVGRDPITGVWGHHPAFGAPLIAAGARLECGATRVVVDDVRTTDAGDLAVGAVGTWPHAPGRHGGTVDLRAVPAGGPPCERMAYLTGFDRGWARITNDRLGLQATLDWDADVFPHAWLWTELHATPGFPWFGAVDVLAVEPCTGYPAQGRDAIAAKTGTLHTFAAGTAQTATVRLTVGRTAGG